jgi:hypothetical protein
LSSRGLQHYCTGNDVGIVIIHHLLSSDALIWGGESRMNKLY